MAVGEFWVETVKVFTRSFRQTMFLFRSLIRNHNRFNECAKVMPLKSFVFVQKGTYNFELNMCGSQRICHVKET